MSDFTDFPGSYHGFDPDLGPADCPYGHFLEPGTFQTAWMPCACPPAAETALGGHRTWRCMTCEAEKRSSVCYYPPHCPLPGQDVLAMPPEKP